jgi:predicted phosphodiesterase
MKLMHLSDLHIGRRLNEISLLEDQAYILLEILQIVDEQKPDAVLIAGDVYDKSVPSAEAVTLLDDFLHRLAQRKLPVLIISGNHDSPERLAFGNRLMELGGIHISPVYDGKLQSVTLTDEHGEFQFGGLTFPEVAHRLWGVDMPDDVSFVDIEAWILCLSMTDAKVFGPYKADEDMLELALDTGADLWLKTSQIQEGSLDISAVQPAFGFKGICESCDWNSDCPKFAGEEHPDLEQELDELASWKREKGILEAKIKARESDMKSWYERANLNGSWITAGNHRFKASEIPGRRKLDKDALEADLENIFRLEGIEGIDVATIIERNEEVGEPSTRLYFNTVK